MVYCAAWSMKNIYETFDLFKSNTVKEGQSNMDYNCLLHADLLFPKGMCKNVKCFLTDLGRQGPP